MGRAEGLLHRFANTRPSGVVAYAEHIQERTVSKFKPYSRLELRRRRREWSRRYWLVVTGVAVGVAVMLAIASAAVIASISGAARWYLLGAVHAGLLAAGLHLLQSAFFAHDR